MLLSAAHTSSGKHTRKHTVEHTEEHTDFDGCFDAEARMWNRLWNLLDNPGDDDWSYVYLVDQFERTIKPYFAKFWLPATDLIWTLQTDLGGGLFRVMIRTGRVMRFSGVIGVAPHPSISSTR